MAKNSLAHARQIVVWVALAQRVGLLDGQARRDVAVERVVGGGLVGDDVYGDVAAHKLGQHLGRVAKQPDRQRAPFGGGL